MHFEIWTTLQKLTKHFAGFGALGNETQILGVLQFVRGGLSAGSLVQVTGDNKQQATSNKQVSKQASDKQAATSKQAVAGKGGQQAGKGGQQAPKGRLKADTQAGE